MCYHGGLIWTSPIAKFPAFGMQTIFSVLSQKFITIREISYNPQRIYHHLNCNSKLNTKLDWKAEMNSSFDRRLYIKYT